jgi:hypothetical protein
MTNDIETLGNEAGDTHRCCNRTCLHYGSGRIAARHNRVTLRMSRRSRQGPMGRKEWIQASPTVDNGVVYTPNYGDGTVAAFGLKIRLRPLPLLQLHPLLHLLRHQQPLRRRHQVPHQDIHRGLTRLRGLAPMPRH